MTYEQTLDYLYSQFPAFQKIGGKALTPNLDNITRFCEHLGNPQNQYPTIHVAGTNGKGSSSHLLSAILQSAGYKVGLYTSPHLKSFTERLKINGEEISPEKITGFVQNHQAWMEAQQFSFFEITVAMAFGYFAKEKVDVAVIEVGLGGRFDATNVIKPEICLITNISLDHQQILGNTLDKIAGEKAGIIKPNVPVVISERQTETVSVFEQISQQQQAPLYFAEDDYKTEWLDVIQGKLTIRKNTQPFLSPLDMSLKGGYQGKNVAGVLKVVEILQARNWQISLENIRLGLKKTSWLTQLKGRWQILRKSPLTICDTAHNEAGLKQVMGQLQQLNFEKLHIVFGTMSDKALDKILPIFPTEATYYFCAPKTPRALAVRQLQVQAGTYGLLGETYPSVNDAYKQAQRDAYPMDVVFVGGSTFVVAELDDL